MNQGAKSVKKEMYSAMTEKPAKRQKLFSAGMLEIEPMKNAIPSVTDVIVIDGPT